MRRLKTLPWHRKQQAIAEPGQPATAAAISRADAQTRQTFIIFRCENPRLRSTYGGTSAAVRRDDQNAAQES